MGTTPHTADGTERGTNEKGAHLCAPLGLDQEPV
jgi:hypothetical protein